MKKSSKTMLAVAAVRAENSDFLGKDPIANNIVANIQEAWDYKRHLDQMSRGMFSRSILIRSQFFTTILANSSNQYSQLVVLCAGLDFRFLNFHNPRGVFVIDHPESAKSTSELTKPYQKQLASASFLHLDLEKTSTEKFKQSLCDIGFKPDEPTLFLWEGATYYLTRETVERTLTAISLCAFQFRLAVDFANYSSWRNPERELDEGAKQALEYLNKHQEPWRSFHKQENISLLLKNNRIHSLSIFSDADLENQYLKESKMKNNSMFYVDAKR